MSLITPDNIAAVLTGVAAVASAVGGWALWRGRKEPAPPGTVDATREALVENTEALRAMHRQFKDNNRLFGEILSVARGMASDIEAAREHLNVIRDHGGRK